MDKHNRLSIHAGTDVVGLLCGDEGMSDLLDKMRMQVVVRCDGIGCDKWIKFNIEAMSDVDDICKSHNWFRDSQKKITYCSIACAMTKSLPCELEKKQ